MVNLMSVLGASSAAVSIVVPAFGEVKVELHD